MTLAGQKGYDDIVNILLRTGASCEGQDAAWKADCEARRKALGL